MTDFVCVLRIIIDTLDVDLHPRYMLFNSLQWNILLFSFLLLFFIQDVVIFNGEKSKQVGRL